MEIAKSIETRLLIGLALLFSGISAGQGEAFAQDDGNVGIPDPAELAEKELTRLDSSLKFEDWQLFYLDSTLRYNYEEWFKELEGLQRAGAENQNLYLAVKDKWMTRTEEAYKKFMTPKQWEQYLKDGGYVIIKERERRQAKMQTALDKIKKKKK